jgi:hypothetical protein
MNGQYASITQPKKHFELCVNQVIRSFGRNPFLSRQLDPRSSLYFQKTKQLYSPSATVFSPSAPEQQRFQERLPNSDLAS